MTKITTETKFTEVFTVPELAPFAKYLMYSPVPFGGHEGEMAQATIGSLSAIGWAPEGITAGLNAFLEAIEDGRVSQHFVYDSKACEEDPQKADVNLIRIVPKEAGYEKKPYILLAAGGAYGAVCTMVESLPTARHMLERGYQVFLFTYRVGRPGVMPEAVKDIAAAVGFIGDHSGEFSLDPARYAVGGFSAGANLVSTYGLGSLGWKKAGLPKPLCLFPVYTFVDLAREAKRDENGGLLPFMFGENWKELWPVYDLLTKLDGDYPPNYLVCGRDDNTVPPVNSEMAAAKLKELGVPVILDEGDHAQHGFGDGTGTDVEGWPERALDFLETLA